MPRNSSEYEAGLQKCVHNQRVDTTEVTFSWKYHLEELTANFSHIGVLLGDWRWVKKKWMKKFSCVDKTLLDNKRPRKLKRRSINITVNLLFRLERVVSYSKIFRVIIRAQGTLSFLSPVEATSSNSPLKSIIQWWVQEIEDMGVESPGNVNIFYSKFSTWKICP